ncbi:MAG: signal recognition particle-docking protein FtsY [Amphritea sp.]|nr:signal recognition particle-docking protein FtsY [Amphritea sp.]
MFKKLKSIFGSDKSEKQNEALNTEVVETEQPEVTEEAAAANTAEQAETVVAETAVAEPVAEADAVEVAEESPATEVEPEPEPEPVIEAETQPEVVEAEVEEAAAEDTALEEPAVEEVVEPEAVFEPEPEAEPEVAVVAEPEKKEPEKKKSFFGRIKAGLSRTKENLTEGLGALFLGAKEIDDDLLEEIETHLLMADVGVEATTEIISKLTDRVSRKQLADADALYAALKEELAALLDDAEQPLDINTSEGPYVILMVGVNGVGKTTTIGKMAKKFQAEGKSVMLAAGDTFRAAAVEQLQVWGERNNVPVVAQHTGADSASVLYDALQSAQAKNVDVVIADTAGRLQNKDNLMQELEKVVRVMKKLDPSAPHEVMLTLDAGTGQNAMSQATLFKDAVGVSGITLTKLDGTAKGGIIFAIAKQLGLPIRYIGVGEQVDDLRPFKAKEFVSALFD